ncbi:NADH-ubiquinone oxidoreductase-F iron-sulfur binding region domain-containing protein [Halostella salina]|uniref:NADH-ubiquinone oxidoreductase-F iron-sulfur binding region domain-containing protein n=1 Tax=Halostella salina TaxID=1547897 RepID=UPI000EF7F884|nr:NADH-ubiquinone oxidoreductase-F iron-sulfur binding region domain-containing protein [Halostella salina]
MTHTITGETPVVRIADSGPTEALRETVPNTDTTVAAVGSTGVPAVEPLVLATRDGATAVHTNCTPERVEAVVTRLTDDSADVADDADAVVEHDADRATLPSLGLPGLDGDQRRTLGACGWRRPTHPADHEAAGGFAETDPEAARDAASDLHGRGWGDWCQDTPVAAAWETAREADGDPSVVVNGHGNPVDALLLASAPFEVLDGARATADAVGSDQVVVYASSADERAVETVREAAANYPEPSPAVDVVAGPPEYRAAEPTMALEAIEGNHRLEARLRPPGPDETGLHGRPTLVHTPRTLAHLAVALREGGSAGTRAVTVRGDVAAPATVELPETATLGDAADAVDVDGEVKAACVGGRFGGITRSLDAALSPDALAEAGLGTEGVVELLAEDRCLVEFVGKRAQFAADENCGRCVPCREGTAQLANKLRAVYDRSYDPEGIAELVGVMESSSICTFGVDAGRPARTAMQAFESEFEAHARGQCPAGSCLDAAEEVTP